MNEMDNQERQIDEDDLGKMFIAMVSASKDKHISIYKLLESNGHPLVKRNGQYYLDLSKLTVPLREKILEILHSSPEPELESANSNEEIIPPKQPILQSSIEEAIVKKSEKRVTICAPVKDSEDDDPAVEVRTKKVMILPPTQVRIKKKLRECIKKISKHKRVATEKEDTRNVEVDVEGDGDVDDTQEAADAGGEEEPSEEAPEELISENVDDDDAQNDEEPSELDNETDYLGEDEEREEDEDEKETDDDDDVTTADQKTDETSAEGEDDVEGDDEIEETGLTDTHTRLNLLDGSTIERFLYYQQLMNNIDFGDCSSLGL
jgi:hypothetical protein